MCLFVNGRDQPFSCQGIEHRTSSWLRFYGLTFRVNPVVPRAMLFVDAERPKSPMFDSQNRWAAMIPRLTKPNGKMPITPGTTNTRMAMQTKTVDAVITWQEGSIAWCRTYLNPALNSAIYELHSAMLTALHASFPGSVGMCQRLPFPASRTTVPQGKDMARL